MGAFHSCVSSFHSLIMGGSKIYGHMTVKVYSWQGVGQLTHWLIFPHSPYDINY